ncbi:MAG: hypothetical protein IKS45_07130, partial [Thermoguttaceae bacterium]|nr:hypothetical protein [Thermoguttaceae bacterium]
MSARPFAITVFPLIIFVLTSLAVFADDPAAELDELPPIPTFKLPPEPKDEAKEQNEKVADEPDDEIEEFDGLPPVPTYTPQSKPKEEAKEQSEKSDEKPDDKRERLMKEAEAGSAEAIIGSGTEIRIPVRAAQNPGYAAGTVDVRWDKTALTLKAVEYCDKAPANSPASLTQGTYRVSFGDYQARENSTAAGEFFTLVFTAADTAAAGTYPVTLDNASVYDAALNAVPVTFKAGKVVLTEKTVVTTTT